MTRRLDQVTEADLCAYVDDQLDISRRIEVEAILSQLPEAAAGVMSDLRSRDELRLAIAKSSGMVRPATAESARRLERGLSRQRVFGVVLRVAAVALLIAAGWFTNEIATPMFISKVDASTPPPAYVEDALRAHGTTVVRGSMSSQPEVTNFDPEDIRAATAIVMPALPEDWRIKDVQIYPSRFGPSVEVAVETSEHGLLSLFAVRPGTFDVVWPTAVSSDDVSAAYFQIGEVAYALVAKVDAGDLNKTSERLANSLY